MWSQMAVLHHSSFLMSEWYSIYICTTSSLSHHLSKTVWLFLFDTAKMCGQSDLQLLTYFGFHYALAQTFPDLDWRLWHRELVDVSED